MTILIRHLLAAIVLGASLAGVVSAQVVQRPPRAYRGLFGGPPIDPNRTRQEVNISATVLGSFDDNLVPASAGIGDIFTPRPEGYSGVGDAQFRYWRGRLNNGLELTGGGSIFSYRGLGLKPEYAGNARASWTGSVGARYQLSATQDYRVDPFYALGSFGAYFPGSDVAPPPTNPATGFSVRRSRTMNSAASMLRRFTPRDAITLSYTYNDREFDDGIGDGSGHLASVDYDHSFSARTLIRGTYRYSDVTNVNLADVDLPIESHTANLGMFLGKPLSPTRRFYLSFGAGSTYVETLNTISFVPVDYWTPSGFASLRYDWARSWSLWIDYTRRVSVIEGLTVQPYVTDTSLARTGGFVHPRLELVFNAGWANGQAAPDGVGRFDTYSGGTQLRFLASRCCSVLFVHNIYAHRLYSVGQLAEGMVNKIDQNAVRLGVVVDLPLFGRYVETTRP
jgi:hypothetical protein